MPENKDFEFRVCPACRAEVKEAKSIGGIWTGGTKSKASNGPMYEAWCTKCGMHLLAMPTDEDAAAKLFLWERYSTAENA